MTPLAEARDAATKAFSMSAQVASTRDPEVIGMGMVAMTYKLNPDSEVEDIDTTQLPKRLKISVTMSTIFNQWKSSLLLLV